ncbi:hypothetical protein LSTR_LSTR002949 [Laodelphax striatellus]|uniref:Endonuclease-reverse transcriptase n=1 Tax=Laodelphax striatellus TaxID=195883 RepID=A0A482XLP9_LAOST|nr:hypothetical protein LSTR_LSTR002949 [Laodelphax striatellus]
MLAYLQSAKVLKIIVLIPHSHVPERKTWTCKASSIDLIRKTQVAMERSILNVHRLQRVRTAFIKSKVKLEDVSVLVRRLKWKWAGHVSRLQDGRWTKKVTEWEPSWRKRNIGRPRVRWKDDIVRVAG